VSGEGALPASPVSLLEEAFAQAREMFLAATGAGFSRYEAAVLIGSFMAASGQGGTGDSAA
jgi:hypothetical protein